jgi:hypothetical protein
MVKVYIYGRTCLDETMLSEYFEIVDSFESADFVIAQSTLPPKNYSPKDLKKIVYIAVEPPLADHRLMCYGLFDSFHTVVTHNPDHEKDNQIPFTRTNQPQFFPVVPTSDILRMKNRGYIEEPKPTVFYAGMVGVYEDVPNSFNGINLTKVRRILGQAIKDNLEGSKVIGIGWDNQRIKVDNWRVQKQQDIEDSNCDFVLALENTMLPNYVYEKIWDGFISDRVVFYLGDPKIEEHVPTNCFVDLRHFFNPSSGFIDTDGVINMVNELSENPQTYNSILNNAREFRKKAIGKHNKLKNDLTKTIVSRLIK